MTILQSGKGKGRVEGGRETGDTGGGRCALVNGVARCMTETHEQICDCVSHNFSIKFVL